MKADKKNNYTVSDSTAMLANTLKLLNRAEALFTETLDNAYYLHQEVCEEDKKDVRAAFAALRDCVFTSIRDSIEPHLQADNAPGSPDNQL